MQLKDSQVTLQQLSTLCTNVWQEYEVRVKVKSIVLTVSQTNKEYTQVLVSDSTGLRIVYNCVKASLEKEKVYSMLIKSSQDKRTNKITCFLIDAKEIHTNESLQGKPNFEKKISNMVLPQLYTKIESIELVSNTTFQDMFDQDVPSQKDMLLKLKDNVENVYYFRIWKNEKDINRDLLQPQVVITFNNITFSKKDGSSASNLSKNLFSTVKVEDQFID